jgi:hypothetical protein
MLPLFLKRHTEYDWLIIYTNDTVAKPANVRQSLHDIETNEFRVISGVMNVGVTDNESTLLDITNVLPSLEPKFRRYFFLDIGIARGIMEVKFVGKSLLAMHRSVFEGFNWFADKPHYRSNDLYFAHYCSSHGIKIHANLDNFMEHLRGAGEHLVGKKTPETIFTRRL